MSIEIITTADGSHSLRNSELNETYHSVHGALQESKHVFIKMGLDHFLEQHPDVSEVNVLEIGFGTGLNAFLTWQRSFETSQRINYTSLETFPIPEELWSKLNYAPDDRAKAGFVALHRAEWNTFVELTPKFYLRKIEQSLEDLTPPVESFDVVYFDAFAPNKQPEMWTQEILSKVSASLKRGGIFVTYCAKGQLKRDLKALNLEISTLSGPPGKKEMVRARKCSVFDK
ncbi:tRNA (5-methylaminomethyl-2-thiouridine)(34)-methyltransferase MnmD [Pseudochryseolinea flava]|uniref:Methyltransferase n=1 Tax=Pseudochryseolinea flava TaxID=2059302 RepID=A0A364YB20_9BACT|nr:tRNA (5-methylaminomethyl-2-thiouridine)(34)-methyltransferase MnmD [Pseudochryseolinea flava]RAW03018.1 methyltransferase [Pseudochryseolinea flava]